MSASVAIRSGARVLHSAVLRLGDAVTRWSVFGLAVRAFTSWSPVT